uniref:Actin filament-associated protein 1 n=1 Tax=Oncorhynchus mykiss TaxID=8022 RepID=A0A8C7P8H3_ONCMY
MEELVCELRLFLDLLDREYLSAGVREKKMLISNILHRVLTAKGYNRKDHSSLSAPPQMPLPEIPHPWLPPDNGPPPLPSCSLPEGYYEEAVPLSPGKAPEYITSNYDSDQMSSSYESYDEEEEDGKGNRGKKMRHQWPSEEASMGLVKDARICAFLLRKKRFGQWTKLLCVIKDNKLLCYKSSKDQTPQMELLLSGCSITHVPKDGKKKKHELKIVHQGADALVLAVQSKEQAEEWLKVLCDRPSSDGEPPNENGHTVTDCKDQGKKDSQKSQKGGTLSKGAGKKITKIIGLGKKKPSTDEQTSSAEEDIPTCGYLNVLSNNRWRERWCRLKDNQLLLHKDRTDLKTHTASLPLRGCEVSPGLDSKHPFAFRLLRNGQEVAVLEASSSEVMGRWLGMLLAETGSITDPAALHYDYIDVETTANVIQLAKQSFCFTSKRAVSPNPYLDNPANSYACPSGMALHYDDVPINGTLKGKKVPVTNGTASKQKVDKNQAKKTNGTTNGTASVKRNNSSAEQYKYGKNRVEADAKMLQAKEEELINRKQDIRNRLTQLKKDRKDLRTAMEATKRSAGSLAERLKKVEDECKLKEDERVSLELEMTEVKESLKKALNGGVTLGLTIEPKSGTSSPQSPVLLRRTLENSPISSCDTSDTESCSTLPVNSASLLRRTTNQKPSAVRGHVLKKAKEWEMKTGT